jgi:hypothetical protein
MIVKPGSCAMNLPVRGCFTLIRPPPRCHRRRGDRNRDTFETGNSLRTVFDRE